MKFERLSSAASEELFSSWNGAVKVSDNLSTDSLALREKFLKIAEKVKGDERSRDKNGKIDKYGYDILLGLELYDFLNPDNGFTLRLASDPDVWRYISMKVVPDVIYERWGIDSPERFYKRPSRIYLSAIWWYIHLSWNQDKEETYRIIEKNSTDEVVNLVERAGARGYRIDFTREFMRQYNERRTANDRMLFRKVLKLNTARSVVLEPELHQGGIKGYIASLFDDVAKGEFDEEASGSY